MPQSDGQMELQLSYVPDRDAIALLVSDIRMRVDIPQRQWSDFLDWLQNREPGERFGKFEVTWSPRLDANLLLFTSEDNIRVGCCLFALPPEAWDRMVVELKHRGEQLRRDYVEPFRQLLESGLETKAAAERLGRPDPFDMEVVWSAPGPG